jgi:tetratricopeptide (TPR) repeat protein
MRTNFTLLLFLLLSFVGLAQKDQIKQAQSELKSGNSAGALAILEKSEYMVINASYEDKSEFYNLKAEIYKSLADRNIDATANLSAAVRAYNELIREEKLSGKFTYIVQANEAIKKIKDELQNTVAKDVKAENYVDGAKKMYTLYEIDKNDTINLFLSTSYFMKVKDYDSALRNYKELQNLNYSGIGLEYYAVNKKTKGEELFFSQSDRDASVKAGSHEKPRNLKAKSKKTEIYINMAFIYTEKGDTRAAESLYKSLIQFDPNYTESYLALAYINLDKKKAISDQMSVLGTSAKDMVAYDILKSKMDDVIKEAISYLEKANTIEPKNEPVAELLLKLYRLMDLTAEYAALKARM